MSIGTRWNLKLGVRATQQEIKGAGSYSIPFTVVDNPAAPGLPIRAPGTTTFTAGSYKFDWAIAPRIGATFDVRGDGTSKLYGNGSARYFERIPNDLAIRALSNEVGLSRYTYADYDIPGYRGLRPLGGNPNSVIFFQGLDGTRDRAGDEASLRRRDRRRLPTGDQSRLLLSSCARSIVNRAAHSKTFSTTPSSRSRISTMVRPHTDIRSTHSRASPPPAFGAYVLANPGDNTEGGMPNAERKYKAIELIANKRFADNWLFYGNFRWSQLDGNYEGLYRNDNNQDDPNITSLFDFPNSPILSSQFDIGPLLHRSALCLETVRLISVGQQHHGRSGAQLVQGNATHVNARAPDLPECR